jgi:hypothetical protein
MAAYRDAPSEIAARDPNHSQHDSYHICQDNINVPEQSEFPQGLQVERQKQ